MQDSLLTPSLGTQSPSTRLYSSTASFWAAFWGGPLGVILFSALNSWRLRRPLDGLAYLAGLGLYAGVLYLMIAGAALPGMVWLNDFLGTRRGAASVLMHAGALLCWSGFYLLHRRQHRSMALFGAKAPKPWLPALGCMAIGYFANLPLARLLARSLA